MITVSMDCDFDIPKWDVALEALMREEYINRNNSLRLKDIERLAVKYEIRFDDLIITALTLLLEKSWRYHDQDGKPVIFTQNCFNQLFKGGRIRKQDVQHLQGYWSPQEFVDE